MRRLLLVLLMLALGAAGCTAGPGAPPTPTTPPTEPVPAPVPPYEPSFDGDRARDLVREQIETPEGAPRYRVPGTEGNNKTAQWIADTMAGLGFEVAWHRFNATYGCVETPMHNVVAERAGSSGRVVIFAAHYDSRPIANKDPDPSRRGEPVLGANDGGSGVGVLLELARVLPASNDTVRFVFFDGEDGGGYLGNDCTGWILGSRAYAATLTDAETDAIRAFVLVDMVGDPDLRLPYEMQSRNDARALQDEVYAVGRSLGYTDVFLLQDGYAVEDDHEPFLQRGIDALDLIHLIPGDPRVFPAWHHTVDDTLDAVSARSLEAVGRTLEAWLHR